MKSFHILHPYDGVMNHDLVRGQFEYECIYTLDAESIEKAFVLGQNDFNDNYAALGKRSTSVGDIIIDIDEWKHYFVKGVGFQEIPCTVSMYIDWGNHIYDIDETDKIITD